MTDIVEQTSSESTQADAGITVVGRSGISGQGPFYEVALGIRGGIVKDAAYKTFGCVWAETIGAMAMVMVKDQPLSYGRTITPQAVLERLIEGIPRSKEELPGMVCEAIHLAVQALPDTREA